jgi:hypothetical protein
MRPERKLFIIQGKVDASVTLESEAASSRKPATRLPL